MNAPELAELHCHLDGSLRPSTLHELASELGITLPDYDIRFQPGMGLTDALARFQVTLSVLQHPRCVERVAREMCEDAAADRITTFEIRFAPQLHHGGSVEDIVDAALSGTAGRAGLILCGLYGESPDILDNLVSVAAARPGVVGIDLAGGPSPSHEVRLADYAPPFHRARELGLGRTVHAAEGRSAQEIRIAIETLGAQRIGHGTTLLNDSSIIDLVRNRDVTIEACPTSNVHTGVIEAVEAHPLPRWLELGVKVCICSDNTLLSDVTTRQEHDLMRKIPGMTDALWAQAVACGHDAAFGT